jgi:hypothetical protein
VRGSQVWAHATSHPAADHLQPLGSTGLSGSLPVD